MFISERVSQFGTQEGSLAGDYLKTLAVGRIYLDNFPHVHAGWVTEGVKLAQVALFFGADDLGGILMEEVVVKATGMSNRASVEDFIRIIREAGKIPVQRNSRYEVLHVH